eukprot:TRINITY_DN15989_c0_g1_i1.p1 TRINITY_DN15989_c0_g1~~TRINITY_DN15989_c0_g1_i1.p1  ORF type:complete len:404 (-),score=36.58 TRINITY_DN15989_c0_g1_i1:184-1395(-)
MAQTKFPLLLNCPTRRSCVVVVVDEKSRHATFCSLEYKAANVKVENVDLVCFFNFPTETTSSQKRKFVQAILIGSLPSQDTAGEDGAMIWRAWCLRQQEQEIKKAPPSDSPWKKISPLPKDQTWEFQQISSVEFLDPPPSISTEHYSSYGTKLLLAENSLKSIFLYNAKCSSSGLIITRMAMQALKSPLTAALLTPYAALIGQKGGFNVIPITGMVTTAKFGQGTFVTLVENSCKESVMGFYWLSGHHWIVVDSGARVFGLYASDKVTQMKFVRIKFCKEIQEYCAKNLDRHKICVFPETKHSKFGMLMLRSGECSILMFNLRTLFGKFDLLERIYRKSPECIVSTSCLDWEDLEQAKGKAILSSNPISSFICVSKLHCLLTTELGPNDKHTVQTYGIKITCT